MWPAIDGQLREITPEILIAISGSHWQLRPLICKRSYPGIGRGGYQPIRHNKTWLEFEDLALWCCQGSKIITIFLDDWFLKMPNTGRWLSWGVSGYLSRNKLEKFTRIAKVKHHDAPQIWHLLILFSQSSLGLSISLDWSRISEKVKRYKPYSLVIPQERSNYYHIKQKPNTEQVLIWLMVEHISRQLEDTRILLNSILNICKLMENLIEDDGS